MVERARAPERGCDASWTDLQVAGRGRPCRATADSARAVRLKRRSWLPAPPGLVRERLPTQVAQDTGSVTKLLHARLTADVTRRASSAPEVADPPAIGGEVNVRKWQIPNDGIWLQIPSVVSRTGLAPDQPPGRYRHDRSWTAGLRGWASRGRYGDALRSFGAELLASEELLDFGCFSGRIVWVLAAAFPRFACAV